MFDCIIVGAGPAGGTAAYHLARRGRSVLLVEKEPLPRYKPCAGGVSPAIATWFDFDFAPVISAHVNTIHYTWKLEDPVEIKLATLEPMWMVRRDQFDQFLVQQAQQQGAALRDNTPVIGLTFNGDHWLVKTSGESIAGRYIIAADGANGPMAAWLGFKPQKTQSAALLDLQVATPDPTRNTAYFEFGRVKNGCIWTFPHANGYSIGAGIFQGTSNQDLNDTLATYASQLGASLGLSEVTSHSYQQSLNLWSGNQTLHTQNALLAGEAAGVVDPFTGEGVRPSIFSGMKAAAAIDQALNGNPGALPGYSTVIKEEWGVDMTWAQRLAGVFYRIPGIGYRVGVKKPTASQKMAEILCGQLRYSDVVGIALKKLSGNFIPGMGR